MKNKKKYLIIVIFILYFALVFQGPCTIFNEKEGKDNKNIIPYLSTSESPVIEWARRWGQHISGSDIGRGVAVDSSDNVYLAGETTNLAGDYDMVLVKYNSSGVKQWNRTWGGSGHDGGMGVAVDTSDNVYLAGYASLGAGGWDMVLVKYDSSGVEQWSRTWGGNSDDEGYGVAVDSSDNVYLAGVTASFGAGGGDMVLVKYDSSGVQQWNTTWGGSDWDVGRGVAVDSSDNVYLAGLTGSYGAGGEDMVLVKYGSSGVQQWNTTWGGIGHEFFNGVAVDSSDNPYAVGATGKYGLTFEDIVLVKYDSSGVQQWSRTWDGSGHDGGMGVAVDSSDNAYAVGETEIVGELHWDMVLVKYNSSGVRLWNTTYGIGIDDIGRGVAVDSSDNVYLAGETNRMGGESNREMVLVKYDIVEVKEKKDLVIPGYNLLFLISVISIITAISLKKKYN